jgi:mannose-6-phosphate isomerase-like protein (cupin superfamily)
MPINYTANPMNTSLEILNFSEEGYKPLVFSADWQVAQLNWEPIFDLKNAGEIERHMNSDEVFILWKGEAVLFVSTKEGMQVQEMQPGVIYNVRKGVWHNLLSTHDAAWIIVENRDTHLHDTHIRQMTADEWNNLNQNLPAWIEK